MARSLITLLAVVLPLAACGVGEEVNQMREAAESMGQYAEGMEEMAREMEEMNERGPAEAIDFRELRETLPGSAAGLPQTEQDGQRQSMGQGFAVSNASRTYSEDDRRIQIEVTDTAGIPMARMMMAWMNIQVDREDDDGYERTTQFEGYPAMESYNTTNQSGSIQYVIANRFLINVEGRNVSMNQIMDAARSVDNRALDGMRDVGYQN